MRAWNGAVLAESDDTVGVHAVQRWLGHRADQPELVQPDHRQGARRGGAPPQVQELTVVGPARRSPFQQGDDRAIHRPERHRQSTGDVGARQTLGPALLGQQG